MNIEVRNNEAIIQGYVQSVERFSKPLYDNQGRFIEKIAAGTFQRAIEKGGEILALLNHRPDRVLGKTSDNTLKLREDSIGLKAELRVTDAEVIQKAKENRLKGWSFGFSPTKQEFYEGKNGIRERTVEDMILKEVTVVDDTKSPAYIGTLIEMREEDTLVFEFRANEEAFDVDVIEDTDKKEHIDLTKYKHRANKLRL